MVRGVRGAVQVKKNLKKDIFAATQKLLGKIAQENNIDRQDIASIFLTATPDLNADFPAYAVREMGWNSVPLLCAQEMDVPGAMKKVIRVLVHVNCDKSQHEIKHQYLGATQKLRKDLSGGKK
jgi:chorismate mutase